MEGSVGRSKRLIMLTISFLLVMTACKWRDDFRDRQQPNYMEPQTSRPTLNRDSIDYQEEDSDSQEKADLPAIDELSQIPELPQYPTGVY